MKKAILQFIQWLKQVIFIALVWLKIKKYRLPNGHPELNRRINFLSLLFSMEEIIPHLNFIAQATTEEFQEFELLLIEFKLLSKSFKRH